MSKKLRSLTFPSETIANRVRRHENLRELDNLLAEVEQVQLTVPIGDVVSAGFRLPARAIQAILKRGFSVAIPLQDLHYLITEEQEKYMRKPVEMPSDPIGNRPLSPWNAKGKKLI